MVGNEVDHHQLYSYYVCIPKCHLVTATFGQGFEIKCIFFILLPCLQDDKRFHGTKGYGTSDLLPFCFKKGVPLETVKVLLNEMTILEKSTLHEVEQVKQIQYLGADQDCDSLFSSAVSIPVIITPLDISSFVYKPSLYLLSPGIINSSLWYLSSNDLI